MALAVCRLQNLPDADFGRALPGKPNFAEHLVETLNQDIHLVAGLYRQLAFAVDELGTRDEPLGLEADVHHHVAIVERDHRTADHVTFPKVLEGLFDELTKVVAADGLLALFLLSGGLVVLLVIRTVDHWASQRCPGRDI